LSVLVYIAALIRKYQGVNKNVKITDADVLHAAALARISLDEDELRKLSGELDAVLDYMDLLSEVDTSGVSPTHHPLPAINAMRDDVARQSLDLEDAVRNAPRHKDGCVVVPKVIE